MNHVVLDSLLTALFILSEHLGTNKNIAENSVYQLLIRIFKMIYQLITGKDAPATA